VEAIMAAAVKHDVAIIPFGGGTSVTDALQCPKNEQRMIVSLDMRRMDRIKWVDRDCMMIRVESGIVGTLGMWCAYMRICVYVCDTEC
jgi:alkyldihydroxyacetonephosphate synthase